jgi:hypothetical protein
VSERERERGRERERERRREREREKERERERERMISCKNITTEQLRRSTQSIEDYSHTILSHRRSQPHPLALSTTS